MQLALLAALTMVAFAANSVFARLALADGAVDPASYTALRLVSGAVVLAVLVAARSGRLRGGSWLSAIALFVYAAGFSLAYITLDTGTGALVLFACVQATMIGRALVRGDRPTALEWAGLALAFGAFVWLVSPGLTAPDPLGTALMAAAGVAWGVYTLRGQGAADPLESTAGNFLRASPMAVALLLPFAGSLAITPFGAAMAVGSGTLSSALGYALWYKVLEGLTTTRAAILQLSVPALAAIGGLIFAGEEPTLRLLIACPLILGGVALAVVGKARRA